MKELTMMDLMQVVAESLERIAFVLTDPLEPEKLDAMKELPHHVRISFEGTESGELFLSGDDGFLREVAAALLGLESDEVVVGAEGLQTLLELGNILCGQVVRLLGGDEDPIRLGLPEACSDAGLRDGLVQGGDRSLSLGMRSDEGVLRVDLVRGTPKTVQG